MMNSFLIMLATHYVADFIVQTRWQAENKSHRLDALAKHVATYTLVLVVVSVILFGPIGGLYAAVNGVLHFATDYFTSKWSAQFYVAKNWRWFWYVIGFDQLIHQVTLALTLDMM
jgi:hypothetical protein